MAKQATVRAVEKEPMENTQHPTSNIERRSVPIFAWFLDVGRWMFDVGCSLGFMATVAEVRVRDAAGSFIVRIIISPPSPPAGARPGGFSRRCVRRPSIPAR